MELDWINSDGSETQAYNQPDFRIRAYQAAVSLFDNYTYACHWHKEFELLVAVQGEMDFFVNGKVAHLRQGDGIFVNSGRLHYGFSARKQECVYSFVVFHPEVLGEEPAISRELYRISQEQQSDYILLHKDISQEAEIIEHILAAEQSMAKTRLFSAQGHVGAIIEGVRALLPEVEKSSEDDWAVLRRMTGFVQSHYDETIRLEEIAAAGMVCRSQCCKLFKSKMNMTPMEYVMHYRLSKACELLNQDLSITEIAFSCGFNGVSYFSECFRRKYSITPTAFREAVLSRQSA